MCGRRASVAGSVVVVPSRYATKTGFGGIKAPPESFIRRSATMYRVFSTRFTAGRMMTARVPSLLALESISAQKRW